MGKIRSCWLLSDVISVYRECLWVVFIHRRSLCIDFQRFGTKTFPFKNSLRKKCPIFVCSFVLMSMAVVSVHTVPQLKSVIKYTTFSTCLQTIAWAKVEIRRERTCQRHKILPAG